MKRGQTDSYILEITIQTKFTVFNEAFRLHELLKAWTTLSNNMPDKWNKIR